MGGAGLGKAIQHETAPNCFRPALLVVLALQVTCMVARPVHGLNWALRCPCSQELGPRALYYFHLALCAGIGSGASYHPCPFRL